MILESIKSKFPNIKSKIDILPIFVNSNKIYSAEAEKLPFKKNILMVSRLTREKRVDIGVLEFKKLLDKTNIQDLGLCIVGSGSEEPYIRSLIVKNNLQEKVRIYRWVNNPFGFYKSADIFLLTSEYEGYGMTLVEAGYANIPIITTKVGLAKTDLFKDSINSYVIDNKDINLISDRLENLITNDELRKSFSSNMHDSIKKTEISKDEYIKKYVSLLLSIAKK